MACGVEAHTQKQMHSATMAVKAAMGVKGQQHGWAGDTSAPGVDPASYITYTHITNALHTLRSMSEGESCLIPRKVPIALRKTEGMPQALEGGG